MPIKKIPVDFDIENFPQYADVGSRLYKIDRITRVSDGKTNTSVLLIVYKGER